MAATKLLFSADLEELFTTKTIDEIEKLSQGLKHDIDRKREELRSMVGERYRDLMEAADTISQMKSSSENVIGNLRTVIESSNNLHSVPRQKIFHQNKPELVDAETESVCDDTIDTLIDDKVVSLAAQIKILTDAPEKMWAAVEHSDFLLAAQLYLFSRHVHTSLTFHSAENEMMAEFPVIDRQWASVAHFHEAILDGCQLHLASPTTNPDKCVEALAAIVLLRGLSPSSLLKEFLTHRENSLRNSLEEQTSVSAKAYIGQTLSSIISFLKTVHVAFVANEDDCSQLESILHKVSTTRTIELFSSTGFTSFSSPVMRFLPEIVRDFTPSIVTVDGPAVSTKALQRVEAHLVKDECTHWLDRMHDCICEKTLGVLEHVTSIAGLSNIRKSVYDQMKDELVIGEWEMICKETLSRQISLWDVFYRNIFLDRIEIVVEAAMNDGIQKFVSDFDLAIVSKDFRDIHNFIWSETNSGKEERNNNYALTMKTKCYSPPIQDLCLRLNSSFSKLLQDISDYVKPDELSAMKDPMEFLSDKTTKNESEPFSLTSDNATVLKFTQRTATEAVNKIVASISNLNLTSCLDSSIEVGRMFLALTELCPAMQKCVEATIENTGSAGFSSVIQIVPSLRGSTEWNTVKSLFERESNHYFSNWIGQLVVGLRSDVSSFLSDNFGRTALADWDSKEIFETAEDGLQVRSLIRVPQYISIGLYAAMSALVRRVHAAGSHALPANIQSSLSQECANAVIDTYLNYSENKKLVQDVALQLHFDLQFLSQAIVARDNQDLVGRCAAAIDSLEKHIDPFDLSVFSPHMSDHVKNAILRNQTLFGVFIPSERFSVLLSLKTSTPSNVEQHNVMRINSINTRFQLLPVSSVSSSQQRRKPLAELAETPSSSSNLKIIPPSARSEQRRSKSPTLRPSASTSFFGSMSSTWFGGK